MESKFFQSEAKFVMDLPLNIRFLVFVLILNLISQLLILVRKLVVHVHKPVNKLHGILEALKNTVIISLVSNRS